MPERDLRATYRLQLSPDLDFAAVRELVPYLRDLGVSHLYLSPSLQARSGSTHGYDVVDPTRISSELGGEQAFRELAGAGLGIVLDIVPNHMGTGNENAWWADEELRRAFFDVDPATGHYRRFFDIDDLAALRQEDDEVFRVTHEKVLSLVLGRGGGRPSGGTTRTGWRTPPATCASCARPGRSTCGSRRSCTRARRCAPGPVEGTDGL
jgi:(1->4)-alpha-D-glucan 1-alpha-D-glucosylmutase